MKILGHSSVAITQQVYAHLHPDAFAEDFSRVAFAMPEKAGRHPEASRVASPEAGSSATHVLPRPAEIRTYPPGCAVVTLWIKPIRAPFAMLDLSEVIEPHEFVDQVTRELREALP